MKMKAQRKETVMKKGSTVNSWTVMKMKLMMKDKLILKACR